jgi:predicted MFS family arabinose efflux permease
MRDPALRVRGEPKPIMATFTQLAALLRQPWPRTVLVAVFIESVFGFGLLSYISPDLQLRFGIGPGAAGAIMAAHGLGGVTYALSARFLVRRLGEAGLARLGGLLAAVPFASLMVIPSPWSAIGLVAVSGVGLVMLHNTLQVNASQLAPAARGTAMSLFATCLFGGMMIGIAAIAPIFDRYGATPVYAVSALVLPSLAFWFSFKLKTRPQLLRG